MTVDKVVFKLGFRGSYNITLTFTESLLCVQSTLICITLFESR